MKAPKNTPWPERARGPALRSVDLAVHADLGVGNVVEEQLEGDGPGDQRGPDPFDHVAATDVAPGHDRRVAAGRAGSDLGGLRRDARLDEEPVGDPAKPRRQD